VQALQGWPDAGINAAERALERLQTALAAAARSLDAPRRALATWCGPRAPPTSPPAPRARRRAPQRARRWVRAAVGFALVLALATAAGNVWGVHALNARVLPAAAARASHVLGRRVRLGRVRWVAPAGALGLGPLAAVGPVEVGPGGVEGSSAELPEVEVRVAALPSLVQRKLVLRLHAPRAQARPGAPAQTLWRPSALAAGARAAHAR